MDNQKHNNNSNKKFSALQLEINRLSMAQREIIRNTFKLMEVEATKNGLGLFVRLFAEYPHYKNIWPQFRAIPDSALISSDNLKNHAKVYMSGLQEIVTVLDDNEKLCEVTRRIARSHCKWNIYKYHIEHMVPELLEVLNQCMGGNLTPEIAEAWSTLYDIIGNMINTHKGKRSTDG